MRTSVHILLAATAIHFAASPANAATNLLVNGSFETGDFTGWQTSAMEEYDLPDVVLGGVRGRYAASLFTIDQAAGFDQLFNTVPGERYQLKFAVMYDGRGSGPGCGEFYGEYWCDSMSVYIAGERMAERGKRSYRWLRRTMYFTALSDKTWLSVGGETPIGDEYLFDDFRVALATDVIPEPQTWALMIAGFGLTGAALRKRRPAAAQA